MKYLLLFSILFLISCGSNTSEKSNSTDRTVSTTVENASTTKDSFFTLLKGNIGSFPITLYLFVLQHSYSGYYYYDSQQQPIDFTGSGTVASSTIVLTAYTTNDSTETFTLSYNGSKAIGSWQSGEKSLPVSLTQSNLPIAFDYIGITDSVRLSDTIPHSPTATAEESTVWPKGNTATDQFIKQQIALLFNKKHPATAINTILQADARQFLDDYKKDSDITATDIKEFPEALNYALDNDLRIAYFTPTLLMLSFSSYSFTGGAHGNYGTSYLPLDLQNNKVLQLKDIITAEGTKQLRLLLEKSYRKNRHLQPSQSLSTDGDLFENKIEPNSNFYVTGKKLVFSYQPYEIAPYAVGEIMITIDFNDLQPFLQPSFAALLR